MGRDEPSSPTHTVRRATAFAAMGWAHQAAAARQSVLTASLWGFVSVVCGGVVITTNTDPPRRVFGNRRCLRPHLRGPLDPGAANRGPWTSAQIRATP